MIYPSEVTTTPEPREFCTIASSLGFRFWRGLRLKKSEGSSWYWRRTGAFFDVLMLTTDGIIALTRARRSRFRFSRPATSFGSTLGLVASVYFSDVAARKFRPPVLSR